MLNRNKRSKRRSLREQCLISMVLILLVSGFCYLVSPLIGYRTVALLLLVAVSILAMFCDIVPVLLSALLSALIWNFFFIPPVFTFRVSNAEDALMFLMYFFIAMLNAVLTLKIRNAEQKAREKEEKEKAAQLYDTLLSSLSHELRTPISTIIGATDNLQSGNDKLSDANKAELLNEISEASMRLNGQVENLLNMSRLESGLIKVKPDWVDISELLHDVVNRLKENANGRVVSVVASEDLPLFRIDYGLIQQVVNNLVQNAILYIPKYCLVTVSAECLGDCLVLVVEDNGQGFPGDETDKVFEKFYRLNGSDTGGTGLGLSIVKGYVEAHHGYVTLENLEGGGARFTIVIPAETSYLNRLKND